jgi:hypothetical protein
MIGTAAKRLALGFALMALPALVGAAQSNVIELTTSSKWHLANSQKLPVEALKNWGEDPAIASEYGVSSIALRTYTLYPENESVKALVETAADASSAYGLFTLYRDASMTPWKDLPLTDVGPRSIVMARGRTFVHIVRPGTENTSANHPQGATPQTSSEFPFTLRQLQTLLELAGGPGPTPDQLRALPSALPQAGLIQGSEKYLLGMQSVERVLPAFKSELIGFSQGAEARLATYRSGEAKVKVLAVTYPTPQIARQRFLTMEKLLQVNDPQVTAPVYGKLTGSFVILAMNADSAKSATNVLDRFKATGYVTWNERYPGHDSLVVQVVKLVLANIIFSFILAGFGLFGGILFFGSKYVARKWFPKSLWGQPDEATIIKLNLQ